MSKGVIGREICREVVSRLSHFVAGLSHLVSSVPGEAGAGLNFVLPHLGRGELGNRMSASLVELPVNGKHDTVEDRQRGSGFPATRE